MLHKDNIKLAPLVFVIAVIIGVSTFTVPAISTDLTHAASIGVGSPQTEAIQEPQSAHVVSTVSSPVSPAPTPPVSSPKVVKQVPAPAYDRVSIPSIGLSSQIVTVGLTSNDNIDVDSSRVGWWNGSSRPGTAGSMFLDGHNPGVFRNLQNITIGAPITVTLANGSNYTYTVVYREVVELAGIDMAKALAPYNNASQGLNMMTCMGTYNKATGTTDKRLVVYATR